MSDDDHERRSPYGERGLKLSGRRLRAVRLCRSPYGERGLKFSYPALCESLGRSLSLRRAWIEIGLKTADHQKPGVALLTESVD